MKSREEILKGINTVIPNISSEEALKIIDKAKIELLLDIRGLLDGILIELERQRKVKHY